MTEANIRCRKHGYVEKQWRGGESAHPSNLYCPMCDLEDACAKELAGEVRAFEKKCRELEHRWENIQPQHVYSIGDTGYYVNDAIFNQLYDLEQENQRLREAVDVFRQVLLEVDHAQRYGADWYTHGAKGLYRQVAMWVQKGTSAIKWLETVTPVKAARIKTDPVTGGD